MSYHDFIKGREIAAQDYPFYALIHAAMRQADSDNLFKLQYMFPNTWEDLKTRYMTAGGLLEGETIDG